jgi:hypothetical protein
MSGGGNGSSDNAEILLLLKKGVIPEKGQSPGRIP